MSSLIYLLCNNAPKRRFWTVHLPLQKKKPTSFQVVPSSHLTVLWGPPDAGISFVVHPCLYQPFLRVHLVDSISFRHLNFPPNSTLTTLTPPSLNTFITATEMLQYSTTLQSDNHCPSWSATPTHFSLIVGAIPLSSAGSPLPYILQWPVTWPICIMTFFLQPGQHILFLGMQVHLLWQKYFQVTVGRMVCILKVNVF